MALRIGASVLWLSLLGACATDSGFSRPAVPVPLEFDVAPRRDSASRDRQPVALRADWWHELGDPGLDRLIAAALSTGTDVEVAAARVDQARAVLAGTRAASGPVIDLNASAARQRLSVADPQSGGVVAAGQGRYFNQLQAGAGASWEADLFGRQRTQVRAAKLRMSEVEADRDAASLVVATEVARRVTDARDLAARREVALEIRELAERELAVVRAKYRAGQMTDADVSQAEEAVSSDRRGLEALQARQVGVLASLQILTSESATSVAEALSLHGESGRAVPEVDPGTPAEVLRRRPDIRGAEMHLQAAEADQQAAEQRRLPSLTLAGTLGAAAGSLSGLAAANALLGSLSSAASYRLFDDGRQSAEIARRCGITRESVAAYRQSVVRGIAEADASLQILEMRKSAWREAREVQAAAERASGVAAARRRAGIGAADQMLSAEIRSLQTQNDALSAEADVQRAFIDLVKDMGGGAEPADSRTATASAISVIESPTH